MAPNGTSATGTRRCLNQNDEGVSFSRKYPRFLESSEVGTEYYRLDFGAKLQF